ncbi:transglutaminase domain-containing protein [Clostridium polynesiense]|uniref:transglutaminase domain-containing protein n=1 Tax=Clostridium polynesiense TaxID=1325933 RepID=UPI00058ED23B|nr:transglutaminase domain-containing protein [Clostridium polynesiense]
MEFSREVKEFVNLRFNEMMALCGIKKDEILNKLSHCSSDEKFLMEYLYSFMPLSDIFSYDFEIYYDYVKHGIFLRENTPWVHKIPEDIFLNYVLHYRINNEAVEKCRKTFYDMIYKRVEDKNMYDAALEVNYWCAEKATYKATDERTASPLTVLKRSFGRCGEESTFAVTALRSIGIPARQIYTPRWAHCDDNHAWVEVWCDGKWHYLGACEPEPVLNKGWFTSAAARAMLIHSRIFSSYFKDEELISHNKVISTINNLSNYAPSKKFIVKVVDSHNNPVKGAAISFEILNYSEFFPAAELTTEDDGIAALTLGLGTVAIHLVKDNRFIFKVVNTKELDEIVLNIDESVEIEEDILQEAVDILPPSDTKTAPYNISDGVKEDHIRRVDLCNKIREEGVNALEGEIKEEAMKLSFSEGNKTAEGEVSSLEEIKPAESKSASLLDERALRVLESSRGNYREILKLLTLSKDDFDYENRINLLLNLTEKDYADVSFEILNSHIASAPEFTGKYSKEIYYKYVLCPRVHFEPLTDFRGVIMNYFEDSLKKSFEQNPTEIWNYIRENIKEIPEYEYSGLYTTPEGLLKGGIGSKLSQKILFTSICRSLGIPARINKEDLSIEYYNDGFIKVEKNETTHNSSHILLMNKSDMDLKYYQNWTIAVLEDGRYKTLDLGMDIEVVKPLDLNLPEGSYRILVSKRLPNGSVFLNKYVVNLKKGDIRTLNISLRESNISDILESYEIENFLLKDKENNDVDAFKLMGSSKNIVIWLEEGVEPTEHILNEIMELNEEFSQLDGKIIFIIRSSSSLENKTLKKTLDMIPKVEIYYDDFSENVNTLARRVYVDPEKLPLVLAVNEENKVIYGCSGYNVGVAELLTRIIKE